MVNSFALLIIFTLLLLITMGRDNPYYKWLILSSISILVAFFSYVQYAINLTEYFSINISYLDNYSGFWVMMYNLHLSPGVIARLLNIGVIGFSFCFFSYADLCTRYDNCDSRRLPPKLSIIAVIVTLLIMDPLVIRLVYTFLRWLFWRWKSFSFYNFINIVDWMVKFELAAFIVLGYGRLLLDYSRHTIKRAKRRVLFSILCYLPITLLYIITFYWYPKQIIMLRESRTGTIFKIIQQAEMFSYQSFVHMPLQTKLYPLFLFISILIFVASMKILGTKNIFHKNSFAIPTGSLRTANLQAKIFSHAIKNDLLSIKLLLPDILDMHDVTAVEKINGICDYNISRLKRLSQTLDIIVINKAPVDIIKCIGTVIEFLPDNHHCEIEKDFSEKEIVIDSDVNYLKEVFSAILSNSIEAINQKGEAGKISIIVKKDFNEICIEIKDNGCGLSDEMKDKVFEMFFSTKSSSKNWGMGLAYCSRIIQLLNGEITFDSVENVGSTVTIYLPA